MPSYIVPHEHCAHLEAYCRDDLIGVDIAQTRLTERRRILDTHAMAYVLGELRARRPGVTVVDANTIKMNNPGYDILVDDRIRIQVKGRCWIEMIDFAVPTLEKAKAWESDFWIAVDFAGLIDGRHGKYATTPEMAPSGRIDPYILPLPFSGRWPKMGSLPLNVRGSARSSQARSIAGDTTCRSYSGSRDNGSLSCKVRRLGQDYNRTMA